MLKKQNENNTNINQVLVVIVRGGQSELVDSKFVSLRTPLDVFNFAGNILSYQEGDMDIERLGYDHVVFKNQIHIMVRVESDALMDILKRSTIFLYSASDQDSIQFDIPVCGYFLDLVNFIKKSAQEEVNAKLEAKADETARNFMADIKFSLDEEDELDEQPES